MSSSSKNEIQLRISVRHHNVARRTLQYDTTLFDVGLSVLCANRFALEIGDPVTPTSIVHYLRLLGHGRLGHPVKGFLDAKGALGGGFDVANAHFVGEGLRGVERDLSFVRQIAFVSDQ